MSSIYSKKHLKCLSQGLNPNFGPVWRKIFCDRVLLINEFNLETNFKGAINS